METNSTPSLSILIFHLQKNLLPGVTLYLRIRNPRDHQDNFFPIHNIKLDAREKRYYYELVDGYMVQITPDNLPYVRTFNRYLPLYTRDNPLISDSTRICHGKIIPTGEDSKPGILRLTYSLKQAKEGDYVYYANDGYYLGQIIHIENNMLYVWLEAEQELVFISSEEPLSDKVIFHFIPMDKIPEGTSPLLPSLKFTSDEE